MTDPLTAFEDRLTSALRSAGDDAPDATGLAPAARGRARSRSRRTALTSVAAVVAVVGVIGGVALLGDRNGGRGGTPSTDGATETATSEPDTPVANTRVESWRDISVTVPAQWGHGYLDDWCAYDGKGKEPVVERPEGASVDILCGPELGYGVRFFDGSAISLAYEPGHIWQYGWEGENQVKVYPKDAWLGYQRGSGDNLVWVVAEDRATAEQVIGSFRRNEGVDAYGCPAREFATAPPSGQDEVRICRYGSDQWLQQSELLTGQDAVDAVAALDAAPVQQMHSCPIREERTWVDVMAGSRPGNVQIMAGCSGVGWGGQWHELTSRILYWALSPGWSGGFDSSVPLPNKLRQ
jgi:hypothetical protein